MKILTITHSYGADGAAIMLKKTATYWINALGYQIDALVDDDLMALYGEEIASCGMNPVQDGDITAYDLVLINTLLDAGFVENLHALVPVALWVHEGVTFLNNIQETSESLSDLFAKFDLVIFQTDWQRLEIYRNFVHRLPTDKIAVIPNGIDMKMNPPARSERRIRGAKFKVVNVGSVYSRKRQADLATVIAKISHDSAIECEFIGDLTHADSFGTQFINDIGKIDCNRWLGSIPHAQVLERLAGADLFCFPSGDESFGLAPLEAAGLGVPVVLADLPPYKFVGWRHKENCLLYPVGDLMRLEACIRTMMGDAVLYEGIQEGGRQLARSLSWDRFLEEITRVIVAVCQKNQLQNK